MDRGADLGGLSRPSHRGVLDDPPTALVGDAGAEELRAQHQAWRDHVARLGERAAALNERGFSAVRFEGPATDLTVGLIDGHRWLAATFPTTWGPVAVVNMPTEEVFTTPDRNRVEGTVRMTKPVLMTGG